LTIGLESAAVNPADQQQLAVSKHSRSKLATRIDNIIAKLAGESDSDFGG
jgi:hypothetical protein